MTIVFIICIISIAINICLIILLKINEKEYEDLKERYDSITKVTCQGCKHLYYNNDGSVDCDSSYKDGCLSSNIRPFKERE